MTSFEIECNLSFIILERLQKTRGVPIPPGDVPKGCGGSDEETEGETEAAFDMSLDEGIAQYARLLKQPESACFCIGS